MDDRGLYPATTPRPKLTPVSLLQLQVEDKSVELSLDGVQLPLPALAHRPTPFLQYEGLK